MESVFTRFRVGSSSARVDFNVKSTNRIARFFLRCLFVASVLVLSMCSSIEAQVPHDTLVIKNLSRFIQSSYPISIDSSLLICRQVDSICASNLVGKRLTDREFVIYLEYQASSRFMKGKRLIELKSYDDARISFRSGKAISKQLEQYKKLEYINVYCDIGIGNSFYAESKFDSAFYYLKKANLRSIGFDRVAQAKALEKLAMIYQLRVEYKEALKCLNEVKRLYVDSKIPIQEANTLNSIATLYMMLDDYESAKHYALESLEILNNLGPKSQIGVTQLTLGKVYKEEEDYDKALEMYYEALNIFKAMNNSSYIASTLREIAHIHSLNDECDIAVKRLDEAISTIDTSNFDDANVALVIDVGNSYLQAKDTAKAIAYLRLGVNTALEHGRNQPAMVGSMSLYRVHKTQGNIDKALEYLEYHTFLVKKSYNIETGTKFIENRVEHKYDEKSKSDWDWFRGQIEKGNVYRTRLFIILISISVVSMVILLFAGYRLLRSRIRLRELEVQLEQFGFESNIGLSKKHKEAIETYIEENEIDFRLTKEYEEQISYILRHPRAEQNEIAKKLNVSVDAIKKRFTKMYDRFNIDSNGSGGKRANLLSLLINILNNIEVPSI